METFARITVKAVPNSSKDEIVGWLGDDLKVRVRQPPEKSRANRHICRLIAECLGLPERDVEVTAGASSARKTVAIRGLETGEARKRLA